MQFYALFKGLGEWIGTRFNWRLIVGLGMVNINAHIIIEVTIFVFGVQAR